MAFARVALREGAALYRWEPVAAQGWAGYVLPSGAATITTLSAAEAWNDHWGDPSAGVNGGVYVFASSAPSDPAASLDALLAIVETLNGAGPAWRYFLSV